MMMMMMTLMRTSMITGTLRVVMRLGVKDMERMP